MADNEYLHTGGVGVLDDRTIASEVAHVLHRFESSDQVDCNDDFQSLLRPLADGEFIFLAATHRQGSSTAKAVFDLVKAGAIAPIAQPLSLAAAYRSAHSLINLKLIEIVDPAAAVSRNGIKSAGYSVTEIGKAVLAAEIAQRVKITFLAFRDVPDDW